MRSSTIASIALLGVNAVTSHSIFQRLKVNDVDQGQLTAVRAPSSDSPILSVTSSSLACNTNLYSPVSSATVTIPAGAKVGAWWEHVLGGPQGTNDPDNPIAASHKGPLIVYLASVSNAATASTSGLSWFKIAEEGLDTTTGKWGVDTMIAGAGWWSFTLPACVKPGQYLMRVELIALHSAYSEGGAQFYMSCANIAVTGAGTKTGTTVQFPGAYSATDPGILINIYSGSTPNNGLKPYTIPGPAKLTC